MGKKRKTANLEIVKIASEAAKEGLSYGQWQALYGEYTPHTCESCKYHSNRCMNIRSDNYCLITENDLHCDNYKKRA